MTRPAAYAHVPDVQGGPVVPILINLVIGLALTAVSALLAPKPSQPKNQQVKQRQLRNINGSDRFGATAGFDTLNTLADYAKPIQVIFARREDGIGGVLVTPEMVWSRAFSYGTEQGVKMMFVIGESGLASGINRPDLEGIFLGTTALDIVHQNQFAFYWNRNTNINGRILAKNFAYGTRGTAASGDLQGNDDIFLCPSRTAVLDTAFSGAFSPTSNSQFGCFAPIANGTGYRVNFRLVSLPVIEGDNDKKDDRTNAKERVKITGNWGEEAEGNDTTIEVIRRLGMKGVGREYNRFMGITELNGVGWEGSAGDHKRRVVVSVGDTCTFTIGGRVLEEDRYWTKNNESINVDDINNATIKYREQADDALQIGTTVMIGRTLWVVESRLLPIWGQGFSGSFDERQEQRITLRCIELFAAGGPGQQIGLISNYCNRRRVRTDDQGQNFYVYPDPNMEGMTVGPGYYPLMRVALGNVRNTRACDTTEIGIKSQVWNRANNLCNFSSLPKPKQLIKSDKRGENVTSGTMNTYFKRTSVFTIFLRPAGTRDDGSEYDWAPLGEQFAIQGSNPVDQYNFIRIQHPDRRQYEFRFVPKNGADLAQHSPDAEPFWLLDARINSVSMAGARLSGTYSTAHGTFTIHAVGRMVTKGSIEFSPELSTGTKTNEVREYITVPATIVEKEYYPDLEPAEAKATEVVWNQQMLPDGYTQGRQAACWYELWGKASYFGLTKTVERRFNFPDGRFIKLKLTGIVNAYFPDGHPYFPGWRAWNLQGIKVTGSSTNMNNNDVLDCIVPISPGNPRNPYGLPYTGIRVVVGATNKLSVPGGRESAWEYEVLGNAEILPIDAVRSAVFTLTDEGGSKSIDIKITGRVIAGPPEWQAFWQRKKAWEHTTYEVVPGSAQGNWSTGMTDLHTVVVSAGNPFFSTDATVGLYFEVTDTRTELEAPGLRSNRVFEENGQITDLSNYQERTTSCENGPEHEIVYVNETVGNDAGAPQYDALTTCGLALRASTNFRSLDQLRIWLKSGIEIERFHPSERGTVGPSNMLPDLLSYLLTDTTAGIGKVFSADLIDTDSFGSACQFLRANKLFFNGGIAEPQNIRSWITEVAPFFLLNFVIANGRFALQPAIPTDSAGNISQGPVPISALFTGGNIIEDSFRVEYLEAEQRKPFIAAMRWRLERVNQLPEERVLTVRRSEASSDTYPLESFDMTPFCCSREHAGMAARFFLSLRDRVTHTVTFKTTPYGLDLAPGNYIRVQTESSPYQSANNGAIEADGTVVSTYPLSDMTYPIHWFNRASSDVDETVMTIADGKVVEQHLWGSLFTLKYGGQSTCVYQVEQLTLDEEGLVEVVAVEFPTTDDLVSLVALDVLNEGAFIEND